VGGQGEAEDFGGEFAGYGKVPGIGGGMGVVGGEGVDGRIEVSAGMYAKRFEAVVEVVARDSKCRLVDENRIMGVIICDCFGEAGCAQAGQWREEFIVDFCNKTTPGDGFGKVPKVVQSPSSANLVEFRIYTQPFNGGFRGYPEVTHSPESMIYRLVGANHCTTLNGIKYLGGVKAEGGDSAMIEH